MNRFVWASCVGTFVGAIGWGWTGNLLCLLTVPACLLVESITGASQESQERVR